MGVVLTRNQAFVLVIVIVVGIVVVVVIGKISKLIGSSIPPDYDHDHEHEHEHDPEGRVTSESGVNRERGEGREANIEHRTSNVEVKTVNVTHSRSG